MKNIRMHGIKEFITASVLLMLVLPLAAVERPEVGVGEKEFSIGPRASFSSPQDAGYGQWYGGAQTHMRVSANLALEGSIEYRSTYFGNYTVIKTYPVQFSLLSYLKPGDAWSPYLLGGGGWYYTLVNGPVGYSSTSYRFGIHVNALDQTCQDSGSMFTIALNLLFGDGGLPSIPEPDTMFHD